MSVNYDIIEYPDGRVEVFLNGVDETIFTQEKSFPLGSKLVKRDGRRYTYYHKIKELNGSHN